MHCETGALVDRARDELRRTTPEGTLADWEKAHPAIAEALAIQTAAYLADCAGAHLYVVHLSSRDGLEAVRRARAAGFRFTVETTTPYLGLSSYDPNGFLAKMVPPVRPPEHHDALWEGFRRRRHRDRRHRQHVALPRHQEAAKPDCTARGPACRCWARICPRFCTTAASAACRWRSWWSAPPARRPGSTGSIRARARSRSGSDADLVVVDLDAERVVSADDLKGMSDFSPFEGKRLRGWPVATIKGGEIVARDGEIVGPPTGRYIPRQPKPAVRAAA